MRNDILKGVNIILFVAVASQLITGFFPQLADGVAFQVHSNGGYVVLACVAAHLVLNWGWIRTAYFTRRKKRLAP